MNVGKIHQKKIGLRAKKNGLNVMIDVKVVEFNQNQTWINNV